MKVGVMGAGAIGCYVGGRLLASGVPVVLIGRPALATEIAEYGMRLSDYAGRVVRVSDARVESDPAALADCDVVLVTVKSGDTAEAGRALAGVLAKDAIVVSFQNGVGNPAVLRERLPHHRVLAGMVPFNVLRSEGGRFHQGTSGDLIVERGPEAEKIVALLDAAGLPAHMHDDVRGVLWGKLLVNLNNSVNALAGVPIREMLDDRGYRRVMAACAREAMDVLARAGIRPILPVKIPPRLIPRMLTLPNALFSIVRLALPHVDPHARSSMWDDLSRGRKTEIDALNGEIVRLAAQIGAQAPVSAKIVELVRGAEGKGSPEMSSASLRAALGI